MFPEGLEDIPFTHMQTQYAFIRNDVTFLVLGQCLLVQSFLKFSKNNYPFWLSKSAQNLIIVSYKDVYFVQ